MPAETARSLEGRRVVVVGASAGIGRALVVRAVGEGAKVVAAARRSDRLAELTTSAGGGIAVTCDVRDDAACRELAEAIAAHLGQIDLLVLSVGLAPLTLLEDASAEQWSNTFDTNVVGVHRVVQSALPHLAPGAIVAVLSSETVGQPRPAMGIYSATKAGVDQMLAVWRAERADIRFTRVIVGSTIDTEFGVDFPIELLTWALEDWQSRGLLPETFLVSDTVAEALAGTLATMLSLPSLSVDSLTLRPASRAAGTPHPPTLSRPEQQP
jgi:NAD(P)-dependent dehydrogenase (short-subunit alcohol dehydrogenase family)